MNVGTMIQAEVADMMQRWKVEILYGRRGGKVAKLEA